MIRKFMRWVAAALCCLPAVSIAASDDPKELERVLAKVRSEPLIFVVATGEPNACVSSAVVARLICGHQPDAMCVTRRRADRASRCAFASGARLGMS
jgi:hypothetical protein